MIRYDTIRYEMMRDNKELHNMTQYYTSQLNVFNHINVTHTWNGKNLHKSRNE